MSDHDFEHQKAETFYTIAEMFKGDDPLGEALVVTLELHFVATASADPEAALRALKMFGYAARLDGKKLILVEIPDLTLSAENIWLHEERCTKIALERGFEPDGWGFWGD